MNGREIEDSAAYCADLVRSRDFTRYAATIFVPAEQRRALLALYAFNVEITRVREQVTQALPGEIRLQWWTDLLTGHARGSPEGNPVASELLLAVKSFDLSTKKLSRLIDEHQFDLYNDPMPTMAALEGYVADTSSALFAIAARVAAPPLPELEHLARHAGFAQGLVEVIARLSYDASRRQLFLPQQLLTAHGSDIEEVFAGKQTPRLRAAVDQLLGESRQHLEAALSLLTEVPPAVRPVFLPLAAVKRDVARLSRPHTDPFIAHAPLRLSTLWTLWRASRSKPFS